MAGTGQKMAKNAPVTPSHGLYPHPHRTDAGPKQQHACDTGDKYCQAIDHASAYSLRMNNL